MATTLNVYEEKNELLNSSSESFNKSIFNNLVGDQPIEIEEKFMKSLVKFMKYVWSNEDSQKLFQFIGILSAISLISCVHGWKNQNFGEIENGFQTIMHVGGLIFSLYATIKSKIIPRSNFSYGYTRIETVAAFSNCVFLILTSLFMLLQSFHSLEIEQVDQSVESTKTAASSGQSDQKPKEDHGNIYILYFKLLVNLAGAFTFAQYALFAPITQFQDIGKNSGEFAYSGLSNFHFQNYIKKFSQMDSEVLINASQFKSSSNTMENRQHLNFTSHFQNMHSVFLHFLVCLLFILEEICSFHFHGLDYQFATIFVTFFIVLVTIILVKKLFITTSFILLQACPIQDDIGLGKILNDISLVSGVIDIEDRQFWGMSAGFLICTLNIQIHSSANPRGVQREISQILQQQFYHYTLQIEADIEI